MSEAFFTNFDVDDEGMIYHLKTCVSRYLEYREKIALEEYLVQAIDSFISRVSLCNKKYPHTFLHVLSMTMYIDRMILYILESPWQN